MKKVKINLFILLTSAFLIIPFLWADTTYVSGHITQDTTWTQTGSPYIVTGDVTVDSSIILTINTGVEVKFEPNQDDQNSGIDTSRCELIIEGILIAQGTQTDSIKFTSNADSVTPGDWYGIRFTNSSNDDDCIIEYSIVEYGYIGIHCHSSSPIIQHNNIRENGNNYEHPHGRGIYCYENASPLIKYNTIKDNDGIAGIDCQEGCSPIIENNVISGNYKRGSKKSVEEDTLDAGIRFFYDCSLWVKNNIISDNGNTGIHCYGINSGIFDSNAISNHYLDGIRYYGSGTIEVSNNTLIDNATVSDWAGINLLITGNSKIKVSGNSISGSYWGIAVAPYTNTVCTTEVNIDRNEVENNKIGVIVHSPYAGSPSGLLLNTILIDNEITDNDSIGISYKQEYPVTNILNLGDLTNPNTTDDGRNKIYNNGIWDIYNTTSDTILAQGNYWGGIWDPDSIDPCIYDNNENPSSGPVLFGVSGHLPQDVLWHNLDVIVGGDIIVDSSLVLTLEPKTTLYFGLWDEQYAGIDSSKIELIVKGKLIAQGTETDSVYFTSASGVPQPDDWYGITLENADTSSFKYCIVEYGKFGIHAIRSLLIVKYNAVRYNRSSGIFYESCVPVVCEYNIISNNQSNILLHPQSDVNSLVIGNIYKNTLSDGITGICLANHYERTAPISINLSENIIMNNEFGLRWAGIDDTLLSLKATYNAFIYNRTVGIEFETGCFGSINFGDLTNADTTDDGSNIIYHNGEYGQWNISNSTPNTIMAQNCLWGMLDPDSIDATLYDDNEDSLSGPVIFTNPAVGPLRIQLKAVSSFAGDTANYVGIAVDATDSFDLAYDFPEPPTPPSPYLQLYLPHSEWNHILGDKFRTDIRKFIDLANSIIIWDFEVKTDQLDSIVSIIVTPVLSKKSAPEYGILLIDLDNHIIQDMVDNPVYVYNSNSGGVHRFQLQVGKINNYHFDWRFTSVPHIPYDPNPNTIFQDYVNPYYLYTFTQQGGYVPPDSVMNGYGYWIGITDTTYIYTEGEPLEDEDTCFVSLLKDWNLVGAPFYTFVLLNDMKVRKDGITLSMADAVDSGWVQPTLSTYLPDSGYVYQNLVSPWQGYWFAAIEDSCVLIMTKNTSGGKGDITKNEDGFTVTNWELTIHAKFNDAMDNITTLGVKEDATDEFDNKYDWIESPTPPCNNWITVYFEKDDWDFELGDKFNQDIRSPLETKTIKSWTFEVNSSSAGNITLNWPKIDELPQELSFVIVNLETGKEIDMRKTTKYTYASTETSHFRIDVTQGKAGNSNNPLVFALHQSPNPFINKTAIAYSIPKDCKVELTLYDVSGRLMKTLVNKKIKVGYYTTTLEGKNFASGIYFLKFKADDYKETKKLILMR